MSKTTPEEAKALADKHNLHLPGYDCYRLAALIDDVIETKCSMKDIFNKEYLLDAWPQTKLPNIPIKPNKESTNVGFRRTGDNSKQSGDTSLPIGMAPNEEDEAVRVKELPNIPWTGYLHPAPRESSDT